MKAPEKGLALGIAAFTSAGAARKRKDEDSGSRQYRLWRRYDFNLPDW
jgi:hypothetical protein